MSDITVHRVYVEQSNYLLYYTSVVSGIIKNGLNPKAVKAIAEEGARLGIDVGNCPNWHELKRFDAEGYFGIRSESFYGRWDQMNAVQNLCREGVTPGGRGMQMAAILGYAGVG